MARHPERVKVFNFDEVKVLLDHEAGRRILDQLQRLGRSKEAIPVLQTQYASDIGLDRDSIGSLFGTVMCFRAPSEQEAVRSLELIGRTPSGRLVRGLQGAQTYSFMVQLVEPDPDEVPRIWSARSERLIEPAIARAALCTLGSGT